MSMLTRRLQVLIDEDRMKRLASEAERRNVAVSVVVREAIDAMYPVDHSQKAAAAKRILAAEPMPVPDPPELREELDALRGRHA